MQVSTNTAVSSKVGFLGYKPSRVKPGRPAQRQLHRVNVRTVIESQGGRMASIDFVKLCGEKRTLVGRLGVKAYLKGGRNLVESDDRSYLTMFDLQLMEYRTINLATVTQLRCGRVVYSVID